MKKIFVIALAVCLLNINFASAALRVPHTPPPVQPFPESDVTPNINQNINTPGNTVNEAEQAAQDQQDALNDEEPQAPDQQAVETNISLAQNEYTYWWLLALGVLGLVVVLAWIYFRFRK